MVKAAAVVRPRSCLTARNMFKSLDAIVVVSFNSELRRVKGF